MNNPVNKTSFTKSLLAGLLAGIIAALLNIIYTIAYRETNGFATAEIIMPLTIFLGFPILLAMGGSIYFLLKNHLRRGTTWFISLCMAFLAALVLVTIQDTSRDGGSLLTGLRGLCLGLETITCLLAAFLIPYLATHPKIYE